MLKKIWKNSGSWGSSNSPDKPVLFFVDKIGDDGMCISIESRDGKDSFGKSSEWMRSSYPVSIDQLTNELLALPYSLHPDFIEELKKRGLG